MVRAIASCTTGIGVVLLLAVAGCGGDITPLTTCEAADGVEVSCGFQNPEDLARLPGSNWLVVSEMPGRTEETGAGSLVAWRPSDDRRQVLFPLADPPAVADAAWGDPACPGPPDPAVFAPHGVDVLPQNSGDTLLAVVNHGGREAVELFAFDWGPSGPRVTWKGCLVAPPDVWPNDVALQPNGELIVSNMISGTEGVAAIVSLGRMLLGFDTGSVLSWKPGTGWRQVEGTRGSAPNGVAVTPDGSEVYFAEWGRERLVQVLRDGTSTPTRRFVALPHHPDNLSWTADGRLLAAGQVGDWSELIACGQVEEGTCSVPFSVVRIEPATLESEVILDHPGTATGGVSSALVLGDTMYVGTFAGDRVGSAPYAP